MKGGVGVIEQTEERFISRVGKNYYVTNAENNIRITINSNTFRVISVDRIEGVYFSTG